MTNKLHVTYNKDAELTVQHVRREIMYKFNELSAFEQFQQMVDECGKRHDFSDFNGLRETFLLDDDDLQLINDLDQRDRG